MTKSKAKKAARKAEANKTAGPGGMPASKSTKGLSNGRKHWEKQNNSKGHAKTHEPQGSTKSSEGMRESKQRAGSKRKASQDDGDREEQPKKAKIHSEDKATETSTSNEPALQPDKTLPRKSTQKPSSHETQSKAPRLPEGAFVNKRPMFHPAIASPYSSLDQQKIIYVSHHSSFMANIKRVKKFLVKAEKRFHARVDGAKVKEGSKPKGGSEKALVEEVIVKGTGRAVENVVSIAVALQKNPDYAIRLKVGTVTVVDDIEMRKNASAIGQNSRGSDKGPKQTNGSTETEKEGTEDAAMATMDEQAEAEDSDEESAFEVSATLEKGEIQGNASGEVPLGESRVRDVSMLEVGITLKSMLKHEQSQSRKVDPGYPHLS